MYAAHTLTSYSIRPHRRYGLQFPKPISISQSECEKPNFHALEVLLVSNIVQIKLDFVKMIEVQNQNVSIFKLVIAAPKLFLSV